MVSVILPAHDEAGYIKACLSALLASDRAGFEAEVIVVANACTDDTARIAQDHAEAARVAGWRLKVVDTAQPGKLSALNLGEAAAQGGIRAYLDADVIISPTLLGEVVSVLDTRAPRYVSGTPVVGPARSRVTRAYARVWQRLPFVTTGVPGFGFFAVNASGRARWGVFPDIISDDTFVRLHFAPDERVRLPAPYIWPMIEGLRNLVRVRRRQDAGVREIAARFPELLKNDDIPAPGIGQLGRIAATDPLGFAAYAAVKLLVKTPYAASGQRWARGR